MTLAFQGVEIEVKVGLEVDGLAATVQIGCNLRARRRLSRLDHSPAGAGAEEEIPGAVLDLL